MGSVGVLFAIVSKTATSVAGNDWCLVRDPSPRARVNTEPVEITNHLALDVWNKPNDFFGKNEFVETFQQHLDLTGEAWWIVTKRGGIPSGIWPVRPDRMEIVPHPTQFISHYMYRAPDGQKIRLETTEVIQIRMPNPMDMYRGMGPVQSVLADIDSAKYSAEWNRNFFLNSAQPGGILKFDHELDDDEYRKIRDRWREQHQGTAQAHRVAIIDGGEWIDRKFTMQDMQFKELRELSSEVIREAFSFPKPLLGTVEDVNRANAEAAEVVFARWTLEPRLERIKSALNNEFLPMFGATGQGVHFEYKSPVPENVELENATLLAKAQAASLLRAAGYDPHEILAVVGLPDMSFIAPPVAAPKPALPPNTGQDQMNNLIRVMEENRIPGNFARAILNNVSRAQLDRVGK
jgi:HK97 family phage portal protein